MINPLMVNLSYFSSFFHPFSFHPFSLSLSSFFILSLFSPPFIFSWLLSLPAGWLPSLNQILPDQHSPRYLSTHNLICFYGLPNTLFYYELQLLHFLNWAHLSSLWRLLIHRVIQVLSFNAHRVFSDYCSTDLNVQRGCRSNGPYFPLLQEHSHKI